MVSALSKEILKNYEAICAFEGDLIANQSRSWLNRKHLVVDAVRSKKGSEKEAGVLHYRALSLWEHFLDWIGASPSTRPSRIASFCAEKKINDTSLIQLYSRYIKEKVGHPQLLSEKEASEAVHLFYHFRPHQLDDHCKLLLGTLIMKAGGVFADSIKAYRRLMDDERRWPELMHVVEITATDGKKRNEIQRIFHKMSDAECVTFLKTKEKAGRNRVLPHLQIIEKNRVGELIDKAVEFKEAETALALWRVMPHIDSRLALIGRLNQPCEFISLIFPLLTQEEQKKVGTYLHSDARFASFFNRPNALWAD